MLVPVADILKKAQADGYAVGAFNTVNLETTRAIIDAARDLRSPLVIQVTEKTLEYAGGRAIFNLVKNVADFYAPDIPIGIHLDHGKGFDIIKRVIDIGFTSVMFDGSRKQYEDNLMVTKEIAEYCHSKGVNLQGELGSVPYLGEIEMMDVAWNEYMTDPGQAEEFVKETKIDALAVAIGNAHGFFRERSEPDYARLEMIQKRVSVPLILHGASDWENGRVSEVIKRGITCFNVDTAVRVAFINSLIKASKTQEGISFDIRKSLGSAREAVKDVVKSKIKIFGSDGKA
ncbi:class II fructose-bisphosphate aldolase [Patescibacteria group bacterium]|nr:MAG: class II fructose-bisphosphate aldolase [Patescibacteria group bacterium]